MSTQLNNFIKVLEEMFQFDQADLDFGIYRIMNQKREEVSRFLNKDLIPQVKQAFEKYKDADIETIKEEINKLEKQLEDMGVAKESSEKYVTLQNKLNQGVDIVALENEVFSDLTNFFKRYYHEGDFLSLRRYKKDIYAIPYEGEEVKLHWANADQYYVKSSEHFRDYSFTLPSGKKVHFKLVDANTEQNNNKAQEGKERRFILTDTDPLVEENGELIIKFEYRPDGEKRTREKINIEIIEKIFGSTGFENWVSDLQILLPTEKNKKRTLLEKHLNDYTAKNSFDYFIHKDLGGFLRRELDFFIKNEIIHLDDLDTDNEKRFEQYLSKVRVIKTIGQKIICFLEQLEEFQKKLFLKKKIITQTNYCISLDRIPKEFYKEIICNKSQVEEWKDFFEKNNDITDFTEETLINNPYLVLDTRYFSGDFKNKLLSKIEEIDDNTFATLIHSENFQGLSLLENKYRSSIQSIYIDPPYNTDNKDFLYKDNYRHSSWLSLMNDRLKLARRLISENGSLFVQIDYNEASRLKSLLDDVFGQENFVNEIIWRRKQATSYSKKQLGITNDTIYWYSNSDNYIFNPLYSKDDENTKRYIKERFTFKEEETGRMYMKSPLVNSLFRPNLKYVFKGINPPENGWLYSKERMEEFYNNNELIIPENPNARIYRKIYEDTYPGQLIQNIWLDIPIVNPMAKERVEGFTTQKPAALISRIFRMSSNDEAVFLDFFAGSGTTFQSVLDINLEKKINNKCLLIEVGKHFYDILLPRVKGLINQREYSCIVKYVQLESYEDALNNIDLYLSEQQKLAIDEHMTPEAKEEYMLSYMLDVESEGSTSLLNIEMFNNPFDYKMKISNGTETKFQKIDLVETFNYLIGLHVKEMDFIKGFQLVKGELRTGENVLVIWRNLDDSTNDDLDEFLKTLDINSRDFEYDRIYVNGDNHIENLKIDESKWKVVLIEEEFKRLMFDVQDV